MPKHPMAKSSEEKLSFDTHLLDVYLTGLQAEVEAKLRRVARFRASMRKLDAAGARTDKASREQAAQALLQQVEDMLAANALVRETLGEIKEAAEAVLADVRQL
jgi:predicted ATPase